MIYSMNIFRQQALKNQIDGQFNYQHFYIKLIVSRKSKYKTFIFYEILALWTQFATCLIYLFSIVAAKKMHL